MTYKKNGDIYSGFWQYGEKNGYGTYIFNDSKMKLAGIWDNGKIKSGKWIFPNGIYWEGEFDNNKPKGEGFWHFSDTNVVKGVFEQIEDEEAEADEDGNKPKKVNWKTSASFYNEEAFDNIKS